jgi:hypothetical protein
MAAEPTAGGEELWRSRERIAGWRNAPQTALTGPHVQHVRRLERVTRCEPVDRVEHLAPSYRAERSAPLGLRHDPLPAGELLRGKQQGVDLSTLSAPRP